MLLFKVLGVIDIFTAIIILIMQFGGTPTRYAIACILYLLVKGFIFRGDFASMLDLLIAGYMVLLFFHGFLIISILIAIHLVIKGIWSMF
jgi:hypothetical protein